MFRLLLVKEEVRLILFILTFLILVFENNLVYIKNFLIEIYKSNIILI